VKVFGLELFRAKTDKALSPPDNSLSFGNEGWFPVVRESFTGAWQRNLQLDAGHAAQLSRGMGVCIADCERYQQAQAEANPAAAERDLDRNDKSSI
jgi:hypothetical protein